MQKDGEIFTNSVPTGRILHGDRRQQHVDWNIII